MAVPRSLIRVAKQTMLAMLVVGLFDLGILVYFDVISVPYLQPVVVAFGDSIAPFTPLINPVLVYFNMKTWLHPATSEYRSRTRRAYVASVICHTIANLALAFAILIKFSWFMELVYGFKDSEGMCIGPCWKVWTELALLAFAFFAVFMRWDLDGGVHARWLDRQLEKQLQRDAERAAKAERSVEAAKIPAGDEESASCMSEVSKG